MKTLFENPGLTGRFCELPPQRGDLLLEEGDLCVEVSDLPIALRVPSLIIASCHAPSPPSQSRATTKDLTYLGPLRNLAGQYSYNDTKYSVINPHKSV
ncbi:hypothetical protein GCM10022248_64550 [Nonomuraea soli]